MQLNINITINALFIAVILFLILCIVLGAYQGVLKGIASIAAILISTVLMMFLCPFVNSFMTVHTGLDEWMDAKVTTIMSQNLNGITGTEDTITLSEDYTTQTDITLSGGVVIPAGTTIPAGTQIPANAIYSNLSTSEENQMIEQLPVPAGIKTILEENNNKAIYAFLGVDNFFSYLRACAVKLGMNIMSYIISFLIVFLVIQIFLIIMDYLDKLPGASNISHAVGGVIGAVKGLVWIELLMLLLVPLAATSFGKTLVRQCNENSILSILYHKNLLITLISKLLQLSL